MLLSVFAYLDFLELEIITWGDNMVAAQANISFLVFPHDPYSPNINTQVLLNINSLLYSS